VTPPEEVANMVDSSGSMALAGDLPSYLQYQAARSLHGDGGAQGGGGNPMLDAGVGMGVGMMMPNLMRTAGAKSSAALAPPKTQCSACAVEVEDAPFCSNCGSELVAAAPAEACTHCGVSMQADARFCGGCGKPRSGESAED
jgi:membrane protease subunit (stomatin/prohibitin family)